MPEIDVTDILLDSDIAGQQFDVIRRRQVVGKDGNATMVGVRISAVGSIVPTGDNSLVRDEAYQSQAKTIRVITSFRLRGVSKDSAGNEWQPDLVEFNGDYFVVKMLDDYTPFGAGMIEAECSSFDYVDRPPALQVPAFGQLDFSRAQNGIYGGGAAC